MLKKVGSFNRFVSDGKKQGVVTDNPFQTTKISTCRTEDERRC